MKRIVLILIAVLFAMSISSCDIFFGVFTFVIEHDGNGDFVLAGHNVMEKIQAEAEQTTLSGTWQLDPSGTVFGFLISIQM